MNDRYMVISPDTLEAMRRAGHAAKLEVRIEKLETALREIAEGPRDVDKSYVSLFHEIKSEARVALGDKTDEN
jgi:hypothetical protein